MRIGIPILIHCVSRLLSCILDFLWVCGIFINFYYTTCFCVDFLGAYTTSKLWPKILMDAYVVFLAILGKHGSACKSVARHYFF